LFRCLAVLAICLTVWSPWMLYQYRSTGYPLLSSKHIPVLQKLIPDANIQWPFKQDDLSKFSKMYSEQDEQEVVDQEILTPIMRQWLDDWKNAQLGTIKSSILGTIEGFYWLYFPFAIYGAWIQIRRRQWVLMDSLLLLLFSWNMVMHWVFGNHILERFLIPGISFYFPFVVMGFAELGEVLEVCPENRKRWRVFVSLFIVMALLLISKGMQRVRKAFNRQDRMDMEIAAWIVENRDELNTNPVNFLAERNVRSEYSNERQPVILSARAAVAMRSASDSLVLDYVAGITSADQLAEFCRKTGVDLVIVDKKFKSELGISELENNIQFRLISRLWEELGLYIYTFNP